MRMVLLALGALVILGGGAAGAYFYFMKPAQASVGNEAVAKDDSAEKDKKKEANEKAAYVEMDPLIVPIIDKDGVSQEVSLVVAIEVPDDKAKAAQDLVEYCLTKGQESASSLGYVPLPDNVRETVRKAAQLIN